MRICDLAGPSPVDRRRLGVDAQRPHPAVRDFSDQPAALKAELFGERYYTRRVAKGKGRGHGQPPPAREPFNVLVARRFLQQAEHDLETARLNQRPSTFYMAAYAARQAAELSIKAAHWYARAEAPGHGHALRGPAERVAERLGRFPVELDAAIGLLEPLDASLRYPSLDIEEPIPAERIGAGQAAGALTAAEEIYKWARQVLQQPPGRPGRRNRS